MNEKVNFVPFMVGNVGGGEPVTVINNAKGVKLDEGIGILSERETDRLKWRSWFTKSSDVIPLQNIEDFDVHWDTEVIDDIFNYSVQDGDGNDDDEWEDDDGEWGDDDDDEWEDDDDLDIES